MDNPQPETTNLTVVTVFMTTENSSSCTTTQNILQSNNNNTQPNTQDIRQLPSIPISTQNNNNNASDRSITSQVTSSSLKLNFDGSIYKFDKIPQVTLTDCMKVEAQQNSTNSSVIPDQSKPQRSKNGGCVDVRINVTCNDCQSVFTSLKKLLDHLKLKVELEIKENIEPPQPNQKTKSQQSPLSSSPPAKSPLRMRNDNVEFMNNEETDLIKNVQQEIPQPQEINTAVDAEINTEMDEEIKEEIPEVEMEIEIETKIESENDAQNNNTDCKSGDENSCKDKETTTPQEKSISSPEKPIKRKRKRKYPREKYPVRKVPHVCEKCGLDFSNQVSFRSHNLTFHDPRTFLCSMENCTLKFATANKLNRHMRSHLRNFKCTNSDCTKTFRDNYNLQVHLKIHADPLGRPFKCETCSSSFSQPHSLTKHMKIRHPPTGIVERVFKCSWDGCDSSFWSSDYLKTHMLIHRDERPHKCQVEGCDASFRTSGTLSQHGAVHKSSLTQLCNYCGKSFKTWSGLRQHESVHGIRMSSKKTLKNSPRPFVCEISNCFKSFTSQTRLSNHHKICHGNRNEDEEQGTFDTGTDCEPDPL